MKQKINEIIAYVNNNGGKYSEWYCGIAADVRDRLFNEHNVREQGDFWIFRNFEASEIARTAEKYFIESLGFDGGPGGGDRTTTFVYVYKKTLSTIQ